MSKQDTKVKKKVVKAWAVMNRSFSFCGNGKQLQAPIFSIKKEAKEFQNECHGYDNGKIVPVIITI